MAIKRGPEPGLRAASDSGALRTERAAMTREAFVLRQCAARFGVVIERGPLGFLARFAGSRAAFCLGHEPTQALARFQMATMRLAMPAEAQDALLRGLPPWVAALRGLFGLGTLAVLHEHGWVAVAGLCLLLGREAGELHRQLRPGGRRPLAHPVLRPLLLSAEIGAWIVLFMLAAQPAGAI